MWSKILDFIKSIFSGCNVKTEVRKQTVSNSPNSVNINGDNNKVVKGPNIYVEDETLVIKDAE